ncbi:type III PLP-dependent enzyme [Vallicoccus soli]|uniref:type III PLP-dependent enzyme n=1 Tax=Vallicoccus soli TaxID=2339232 RepID=UPI0014023E5E|nr:type III PLP-dependent enzyme [Vallicoccus soli]
MSASSVPATAGPTPVLVLDHAVLRAAHARLVSALPGVRLHYAVKCNSDPELLRTLAGEGCGFEVASAPELDLLVGLGVDPAGLLFSNPVKPAAHVRRAHAAGVRRFAADGDEELAKLAACAPGASVLLRLAPPRVASRVASEGKFGVGPEEAVRLLLAARDRGLDPLGLTFHVGSQTTCAAAWDAALAQCADAMRALAGHGVRLRLVDVGGGFPAAYADQRPDLAALGTAVVAGLGRLPYPVEVVAEPGRALVAAAGTMVCEVLGVAHRRGRRWAHLDAGAFNGFMEALETGRTLRFPMSDSRGGPTARWAVTGPTCDSQDTVLLDVALSAGLRAGDRVAVRSAGAYTTGYASAFNGFPAPRVEHRRGVPAPRCAR